jgi:pimeloyl-ACP methyl ester carboxylesterase
MHEQDMTNSTARCADRALIFELADGRTLGYGLYGAHDGPLVAVLDGPGSRGLGRAMAPTAVRLGIKLLLPDRPGFGRSSVTPTGSFGDVSEDLLALVDRLGFRRFGVIAQSGGTPYALALAAAAGDRVTGLAFIGGMAPLNERDAMHAVGRRMRFVFLLARRAPWSLRPLFSGVARQTAKDPKAAARKYAAVLPPADHRVLEDPTVWAIHAASSAEVVSRPSALAREMRMLVRPWGIDYHRITAPVALWAGELDRAHPPNMSHRLATLLGGAPVTVVPGAATFAMVTRYPDALRHSAALPDDLGPGRPRLFGPP